MDRRQTLLEAVAHRAVDVVPHQVLFYDINGIRKHLARSSATLREDLLVWLEHLDASAVDVTPTHLHDSAWLTACDELCRIQLEHSCTGGGVLKTRVAEEDDERLLLDLENGSRWRIVKHPFRRDYLGFPIEGPDDLDSYRFPDPDAPWRYEGVAEEVAFFKERGFLTSVEIHGFYSGVWYRFCELTTFLMALVQRPDFAQALVDAVGEFNLRTARNFLERGVDCIFFCDDLGYNENTFISPKMYTRFILPWHKRVAELCHEYGALCHIHSHGRITELIPSMIDAGIDILNPIDANEGLDIEQLKAEYGSSITFYVRMWPLVDPTGAIDPDAVARAERLATLGREEGGLIFREGGFNETTSDEAFKRHLELSARIRRGERISR